MNIERKKVASTKPDKSIENDLNKNGYQCICGVDEVGRGCLAGPVVSAAVILLNDIDGLNDSKKLSEKSRSILYNKIINNSYFSVAFVDSEVIDNINILNATKQSMKNAIITLPIVPDFVIIDGEDTLDLNIKQRAIVSGDSKSVSIAAASIIAKVTRDNYMINLSDKYPEYGWNSNKGYGTKQHLEAIKKYGINNFHRKSFEPIKSMSNSDLSINK